MKIVNKTTLLSLLMIPILIVSMFTTTSTNASAESDLGLLVDAAILIDADTGKILYEQNAETTLGIASMTKMMTEYILFDAIKEGTISWDQEYRVTEYTYKMSQNRALSNVPLRADGTYTIRELYEAMAIYSANAATVGIAETIAGTETEFVKLMNKKAEELGLEEYKFVNTTGLSNSDLFGNHPKGTGPEDENVMSARSVAKLAYHLLKDHPEVLETSSIPKKTFREGTEDAINMANWNWMLPGLVAQYNGVDGLKTGTTPFAGSCFTGTAERNGTRLISVVMNAVDSTGKDSKKTARFAETAKLLDYGFNQFSKQEIVPANYVFEDQKTIEVTKGKEKEVKIGVKEPISVVVKTSEKDLYKPKLVLDKESLEAEVEEGTVVGKVVLERTEGADYGFIDEKDTIDVVTLENVERAGAISLFFQGIGNFFSNIWSGITGFVGGVLS